jgi:hypothetical protein
MSNASIIKRILSTLDSYESGGVLATDVETAVERSIHALEGLTSKQISKSRDLSYRLVCAHLTDGGIEYEGDEKVSQVLLEFRRFLGSLPGSLQIQIGLIGEGTPCWRPVAVEHVEGNRYRILEGQPDGEQWGIRKE